VARKETQPTLLPSVFDRLIDREPANRNEPQSWRAQSVKELKDVVRRDLEWLLNARRTLVEPPPTSKELWKSVYCYGLPDSTGISVRADDERRRLAWAVEQAISFFEPRLMNVKVAIPKIAASSKVLHFQIEALIRTEPAPTRIYFDSTLELTSGAYQVEDEARAR
jgi:type VI secretion system protein ImpF